MAYVTQQDLIDRFGAEELIQLTDRTNTPATTIDATVVAEHLEDAHSVVDGYIAKQYTLPLAVVPPVLTKMTADIARKFLHGDAADKDHPVTLAYNEAMKWLEKVASGNVAIPQPDGGAPAQQGGSQVQVSAPDRIMSRDSLKGYS